MIENGNVSITKPIRRRMCASILFALLALMVGAAPVSADHAGCPEVEFERLEYATFGIALPALGGWEYQADRLKLGAIAVLWHRDENGEDDAVIRVHVEHGKDRALDDWTRRWRERWHYELDPIGIQIDGADAVCLIASERTPSEMPLRIVLTVKHGFLYSFQWARAPGSRGPNDLRDLCDEIRWTQLQSPDAQLTLSELPDTFVNGMLSVRLPEHCRSDRHPGDNIEHYFFVWNYVRGEEEMAISIALAGHGAARSADDYQAVYFSGMEQKLQAAMGVDVMLDASVVQGKDDTYTTPFVRANIHPEQLPEHERLVRYVIAVPRPGVVLLMQFMLNPESIEHVDKYDAMIDEVIGTIEYNWPDAQDGPGE